MIRYSRLIGGFNSFKENSIVKPKKDDAEYKYIGNALSFQDIRLYAKNIKNFLGVFDKHELKDIALLPTFGIIIYDDHHFTAMVFDDTDYHEVDFFDSFGRTPEELGIMQEVEDLIARYVKEMKPKYLMPYKINRIKKQGINEAMCGSYSLAFIIDRLINHKNFKESTDYSLKKSVIERDKIIKRFNLV